MTAPPSRNFLTDSQDAISSHWRPKEASNPSVSPQAYSYNETPLIFGVPTLPAPNPVSLPSYIPERSSSGTIFHTHFAGGHDSEQTRAISDVGKASQRPVQFREPSQLPSHTSSSTSYPALSRPSESQSADTPIASSRASSPASSIADNSSARQDTSAARGLAYVSLEAAAEPHYIGAASGYMWASMIVNGMQPSDHASQHLERKWPSNSRFSLDAALDSKNVSKGNTMEVVVETKLAPEVAAILLEAVYQHLQPRYPFLDWIVLHDHWQRRDAILQAVVDGKQDRDVATAAFFILMIMAVGSQLCGKLRLPGVDKPDKYFLRALPLMGTIVQLHNLANIQGEPLYLQSLYSQH